VSTVIDLDAYRARKHTADDQCLEPGCSAPALWRTSDGRPFACNDHNPPVPAPEPLRAVR
jgi:hypothetical protein